MASRTGALDLSSWQPNPDQNASLKSALPTRSPDRTVSPCAHPTNHAPGVRSPLASISPHTSRNSSPSSQWRYSSNILQSKDSAPNPGAPTFALEQSLSSAIDNQALTSANAAPRPRSSASSAAVQRPASLNDAVNKLWRLQKQQNATSEAGSTRSPIPSPRRNSSSSVKQQDAETVDPSGVRGRSGKVDSDSQERIDQTPPNPPSSQSQTTGGSRPPRGFSSLPPTLETVEEGDHALSPNYVTGSSASSLSESKRRSDAGQEQVTSDSSRDEMSNFDGGDGTLLRVPALMTQRTLEETDKRHDARRDSASQSHGAAVRRPFTALVSNKVRPSNDGSSRHMTVETETVSSIPQTSMGGNPGERGNTTKRDENGTLRLRSSNETIKPKKEKKRTAKKPTTIISGTTSSKADIFEAKVASAVDEDTSDSDETFVYESNPPEPRARQHRHHSRTPSVTSMQSLGDRRGVRTVGNLLDSHRRVRGKRSMKFASNPYNASSIDDESGDGDHGTVRASASRTSNPGDMQSKYKGLYSRGTGGYASPSESESPYTHAARVRSAHGFDTRHSPKPQSPIPGSPSYPKTPSRKSDSSPYDLEGERADDERAPLMSSIRSQRARGLRRANDFSLRHLDYYPHNQRSWCSRFVGCTLMFITIVLVVMGAAAFLFATTKPLYEVVVREVQDVLASEQEIMLDLVVEATNPNIVAITISDMDVNVFAKSRHVRGDMLWTYQHSEVQCTRRGRAPSQALRDRRALDTESQDLVRHSGGVDKGTDPMPEDPESDPQTMLLGRIFHFDSALIYDGSPLRQLAHNSTGEMRLQRPGNKTEEGGTERWENVIQHPFELIVRGILKYQLPLSSRTMTASIGASVIVHPEEGIDGTGAMKVERVKRESWKNT